MKVARPRADEEADVRHDLRNDRQRGPRAGDSLTGAFARADKALYAAKSDGRDSAMLLR